MYVTCWLSGNVLLLAQSWMVFDPGLKDSAYLATLNTCDITEQCFNDWLYIYICNLADESYITTTGFLYELSYYIFIF